VQEEIVMVLGLVGTHYLFQEIKICAKRQVKALHITKWFKAMLNWNLTPADTPYIPVGMGPNHFN
jgi:hypothetical protein